MSVLVVPITPDQVEFCSDWLWRLGATAIEEREANDAVELIVGFGDDDLALAARSVLSERWPCRLESTGDETEWRDEWLRWIEPIEVAGFVVHAPWHDPALWAAMPAATPLSIDPGRAFGSGHHPTTRMALEALPALVEPTSRVLDVGSGTGILSIAAALLGATAVLGIDLDHDIVEVARANAEANNVAAQIEFRAGPPAAAEDRFDVVVANIVVGDLMPLLPSILGWAQGPVVLSGFLESQFDQVVGGLGARVLDRRTLDGWASATILA